MRTRRYLAKLLVEPLQVRETVTVELPAPAATVWDLMWDPARNGLFDPGHEHGFTVPGTPPQEVGELQLVTSRDADGKRTVHLLEVVEIEPGRRAVTECTGCGHDSGAVLDLEALTDDSCRLTQVQWTVLPTGTFARLVEPNRARLRRSLDDLAVALQSHFA